MADNVHSELVESVLYYGDNMEILRRYIKDESADLVYLDPPFVWRAGCHCEAEGRGNLLFPLLLCSGVYPPSPSATAARPPLKLTQ